MQSHLKYISLGFVLQPSLNPEAGKQNSQSKPVGTPSGVWGKFMYVLEVVEQNI